MPLTIRWLMVANDSRAKIFAMNQGLQPELVLVEEYAKSPSVKEFPLEQFAKQLALVLNNACQPQLGFEEVLKQVTLVMPSDFYIEVYKHFSKDTLKVIKRVVQKDYTLLKDNDLKKALFPTISA